MLHPNTELRFIDDTIGFGVFATHFIPRGTITWVRDLLDQTFPPERIPEIPQKLRTVLDRYAYVDGRGDAVLCWDHARYVNHACEAVCLSPGYNFEIAVRDILPGDQLTDDYGTLNIEVAFECLCGSLRCRRVIQPDDLAVYGDRWDALIEGSFAHLARVAQPLWDLVAEKDDVTRAVSGLTPIASCRENYHGANALRRTG